MSPVNRDMLNDVTKSMIEVRKNLVALGFLQLVPFLETWERMIGSVLLYEKLREDLLADMTKPPTTTAVEAEEEVTSRLT